MSAALSTIFTPASTTRSSEFLQFVTAVWRGIARYFAHRSAIASLRELDDRSLQDIGLKRSQIEAAVRGLITPSRPRA